MMKLILALTLPLVLFTVVLPCRAESGTQDADGECGHCCDDWIVLMRTSERIHVCENGEVRVVTTNVGLPPRKTSWGGQLVVANNDNLYSLGGMSLGDMDYSKVERLTSNGWQSQNNTKSSRKRGIFGYLPFHNVLYACGCWGDYLNPSECNSTCEFRNADHDEEWQEVKLDDDHCIADAAGATYGNQLYISGGYTCDDHTSAKLRSYNHATGKWTQLKDMNIERRNHAMVETEGTLMVCGGRDKRGSYVARCERYNIQANEWTTLDEGDWPLKDIVMYAIGQHKKMIVMIDSQGNIYTHWKDGWFYIWRGVIKSNGARLTGAGVVPQHLLKLN